MSASGLVATATSRFSRLTRTSSVAGFLRSVFSMPCAQKPQTRPLTVISIVAACVAAAGARPASSSRILRCFIELSSKIEHDHGLKLAVLRQARLDPGRSEEHTSELQSQSNLVCRLLLEKKKKTINYALSKTANTQKLKHQTKTSNLRTRSSQCADTPHHSVSKQTSISHPDRVLLTVTMHVCNRPTSKLCV